jgi:hypothetical protein
MKDLDSAPHISGMVELLVGRHDGDHMVARFAKGGEYQIVSASGSMGGDDMFGLNGFIEATDAVEELGIAFDVAIGKATFGERV